jgi:hypothetical protein
MRSARIPLALALALALFACPASTGLRATVERSKSAPARPATPESVEVYFYEKEPSYATKPLGTIDLHGRFAPETPVEDQEWELRERLEHEARALGADTVIVMSSRATPDVEVRALALFFAGKGARPAYEGTLAKKPRPAHKKKGGAKGPATAATDTEVPSGLD